MVKGLLAATLLSSLLIGSAFATATRSTLPINS